MIITPRGAIVRRKPKMRTNYALQLFPDSNPTYLSMEENICTDFTASESINLSSMMIWQGSFPPKLIELASRDVSGVRYERMWSTWST